ncbi:alpha/beta hydrolase [Aquibium sp. A9E412]|uniref:alpha/beta fold hydrolase n=1 Tax=Aquibium sp. A9E412 TaxID=2976767 RepID=UPI0025B0AF95|nr:alpha/beta hydrolase [Aquibium sp. A9E412]MDN2565053.1 alpha/beta hydrolase [Aquibium sp. A9E412]
MSDLLYQIPGNPVPEGATAGLLDTADGHRIRFARFVATGRPLRGTVVILPGRNEAIEKYFETVGDLAARGFATATLDWRGQGASDRLLRDRERGYVGSFDDYVADLDRLFEEVILPDCRPPYYVLGHSTGALVALLAAPGLVNRVRRMVLCAPLLGFAGTAFSDRALYRLSSLLFALGLGRVYMAGGPRPREAIPFAFNKLTTDYARYARNQELYRRHPALALGGPTAAWIRAACRAIRTVRDPEFAARIRIPALFVAAGADEVVSNRAIEDYHGRLRSGALVTVDGARHELLQEADAYREQVLAAFDAFVPGSDAVFA